MTPTELRAAKAHLDKTAAEEQAAREAAAKAFSAAVDGAGSPEAAAAAEVAAKIAAARLTNARAAWNNAAAESVAIVRAHSETLPEAGPLGAAVHEAALRCAGIDAEKAAAVGVDVSNAGADLPAGKAIRALSDLAQRARNFTGNPEAALAELDAIDAAAAEAERLAKRLKTAKSLSDLA
jgi:hypothetical protein